MDRAEIQIWRTGVLGVTTNLLEPSSKMMFMTPLLSFELETGVGVGFGGDEGLLEGTRERGQTRDGRWLHRS